MGLFKDILIGGAALKALNRSDRPGVVAPPGFTLLGMQHVGFGKKWKIIYCNVKLNFTISPGTSGRNSGGAQWHFHWS
jgi:hypothetical protein